jgi:hypothetical protein
MTLRLPQRRRPWNRVALGPVQSALGGDLDAETGKGSVVDDGSVPVGAGTAALPD